MATTTENANTVEGEHITDDGFKLYTKTWKTADSPKAILLFIHGFSDHCNTYFEFFPRLVAHGIEVRSFDQRGWGRSVTTPAQKGMTGPSTRVTDDISSFIKASIPSSVPLFLMGHSMGGQEVLYWMATGPADLKKHIRGYLTESAFIAFHSATKPNPLTVIIGRLAGKFLPSRQMIFKLDQDLISRDKAVGQRFFDDDLCHDTGTLEGLAGNLDRTAALDSGKVQIPKDAGEGGKTRIWMSHGTKDGVCDYQGTERLYKTLGDIEDKELKLYDGWFHQLHSEPSPDKETFANDVAAWILTRCDKL